MYKAKSTGISAKFKCLTPTLNSFVLASLATEEIYAFTQPGFFVAQYVLCLGSPHKVSQFRIHILLGCIGHIMKFPAGNLFFKTFDENFLMSFACCIKLNWQEG